MITAILGIIDFIYAGNQLSGWLYLLTTLTDLSIIDKIGEIRSCRQEK